MESVKFIIAFCLMLIVNVFASASTVPEQDLNLIEYLTDNQIRLVVLRHGEAIHNLTYMIYSNRTPGIYLTETGEWQAEQAAESLSTLKINAVYASPLYRALQTAQIIAKRLRAPYYKVSVDERLREQNFGVFEEREYEEFKDYFSSKESMFTDGAPEAELGSDVFARLRDFLWEIAYKNKKQTILIITHGLNCGQINKCLVGNYDEIPDFGSYRIYDFTE